MHGPEEGVSDHTDEANSAVRLLGVTFLSNLIQIILDFKMRDIEPEEMKSQR